MIVDTHALVWALIAPDTLSTRARAALTDSPDPPIVSGASIWEMATKHAKGKWPDISLIPRPLFQSVQDQGFAVEPVSPFIFETAASLPPHHNDPFDRILIAEALARSVPVISRDPMFDHYHVDRVW